MPFPLSDPEANEIAHILRRRHKDLVWSEDYLLRLIGEQTSRMDVYWSVIGLRHCGTRRCVPALKALSTHPSQDVKASAILTVAQIAGAEETEYYAQCLLDPAYRTKDYALWAIGTCADIRALPVVQAYIQRRKKILSQPSTDPRDQQEIVAYLYRVVGADETHALLTTQYAYLRDSLRRSLSAMQAIAVENFTRRVPKLEDVLSPGPV